MAKRLYVALNLANAVARIDLQSRAVRTLSFGPRASKDFTGPLPYALELSKDGKELYVSLQNGGGIAVVDLRSLEEKRRIKTGIHPTAMALTNDGKRLYVANTNTDTVSVIDTLSGKIEATLNLSPYQGALFGSMPNALALSGDMARFLYPTGGTTTLHWSIQKPSRSKA